MNRIQGTKPAGRKWNRRFGAVVTTLKYKKRIFDHAIYIEIFSDGTISYLTVSTDDVLNTTNNETAFSELTRVLKNTLRLKYNKDLYLITQIYEFSSLLLVSVLIRLITSGN